MLYYNIRDAGLCPDAYGGWPDVTGFGGRMLCGLMSGCHRIKWPDAMRIIGRMLCDCRPLSAGITSLNLMSRDLGIIPVDFLYIFDILERALQIPVHRVFVQAKYEVMTVAHLADAFCELQKLTKTTEING